jgi:hypothetical protein
VLQLHARSAEPNTILVMVTENEFRRPKQAKSFVASAALKGGEWETVKLSTTDFRELEGDRRLASWQDVNLFSIQAQHVIRGPSRTVADQKILGEKWRGAMPEFERIEWVE